MRAARRRVIPRHRRPDAFHSSSTAPAAGLSSILLGHPTWAPSRGKGKKAEANEAGRAHRSIHIRTEQRIEQSACVPAAAEVRQVAPRMRDLVAGLEIAPLRRAPEGRSACGAHREHVGRRAGRRPPDRSRRTDLGRDALLAPAPAVEIGHLDFGRGDAVDWAYFAGNRPSAWREVSTSRWPVSMLILLDVAVRGS